MGRSNGKKKGSDGKDNGKDKLSSLSGALLAAVKPASAAPAQPPRGVGSGATYTVKEEQKIKFTKQLKNSRKFFWLVNSK